MANYGLWAVKTNAIRSTRKWQTGGDAGLDPRMRRPTSTNADTETELERLRRENYRLRMERDVLRALKALREGKLDSSWD
jgi:hypothetical protein